MRTSKSFKILLLATLIFGMMLPAAFASEDSNYDAKLQIFENLLAQKKSASTVSQSASGPYDGILADLQNSQKATASESPRIPGGGVSAATESTGGVAELYSSAEQVAPGDKFSVYLYIDGPDLYAASLDLKFDPAVAKMVSVEPMEELLTYGGSEYPLTTVINSFDPVATNESGEYSFATTMTGPVASTSEGRFRTVVELVFEAVAAGTFNLSITNDDAAQLSVTGPNALVKLSNSDALAIPFTAYDLSLPIVTPEYQVVLNWSANQEVELDLHGWVEANAGGSNYHVYYSDEGSVNEYPFVTYGYDDYGIAGRESIHIVDNLDTNYYFAVDAFDGTDLGTLNSASFSLYHNGTLVGTYPIDLTAAAGKTFWGGLSLHTDGSGVPVISADQVYADHFAPPLFVPEPVNFMPYNIPVNQPAQVSFWQDDLPEPFNSATEYSQFQGILWAYDYYTDTVTPVYTHNDATNEDVLTTLQFAPDANYPGKLTAATPALPDGEYYVTIHDPDTVIADPYAAQDETMIGFGYLTTQPPINSFFGIAPYNVTVAKGEQFTVNVIANGIPDLYSAQFKLTFDPEYLQVVNLEDGDLITDDDAETLQQTDNAAGTIQYTRTSIGEAVTKDHGTLVSITFQTTDAFEGDITAYLEFVPVVAGEPTIKLYNSQTLIDPTTYVFGGSEIYIKDSVASLVGFAKLDVPFIYDQSGIVATLWDVDGNEVGSSVTYHDGFFNILDIAPNAGGTEPYKLTLKKDGYLLRVIDNVYIVNGENNLNDSMHPFTLWAGDVNNDNQIDVRDFDAVTAAFFTYSWQASFNAAADYNHDGFIDLDDLHSIAIHFLSTPTDYYAGIIY